MMRQSHVLVIEDNDAHAELIGMAIEDFDQGITHGRAADGEAALDTLYNRDRHDKRPSVDLILLDLKIPKIDGLEILERLKSHESLRTIPVVVLTTSSARTDMDRAYHNHANGYVIKPTDLEGFQEMMGALLTYWLRWNERIKHVVSADE